MRIATTFGPAHCRPNSAPAHIFGVPARLAIRNRGRGSTQKVAGLVAGARRDVALVEMGMGVEHAGQHQRAVEIGAQRRRNRPGSGDVGHLAAIDHQIAQHQVVVAGRRRRRGLQHAGRDVDATQRVAGGLGAADMMAVLQYGSFRNRSTRRSARLRSVKARCRARLRADEAR